MSSIKKEIVPLCIPVIQMQIGQVGYISIWSIVVKIIPYESKPNEFYRQINLVANVQPTPTDDSTVKITRVGDGISGNDYELDFSDCSQIIEFEENLTQTFKLATTPYQIEPHFVTKIEKYNYLCVSELEEEMQSLFNDSDKKHTDSDIQKIIGIIITKVKKNLKETKFYDLLGVYDDAFEIVARFQPIKAEKEQSKSEYQLMLCDQEIAQATKAYVQILLEERFLTEFKQCDFAQREEIADRILEEESPLAFLEDILYKVKN